MIKYTEFCIKKKLPKSFKTFLKYFSNGIFLFDIEPILGVGNNYKDTPCGIVRLSSEILPFDKPCYIVSEDRFVNRKDLIAFTAGSAQYMSLDHWVFFTNSEPLDHEYKVGYISQSSGNIVVLLDNFEEWLNILWVNNKDEDTLLSVFHALYPDTEQRDLVLQIY